MEGIAWAKDGLKTKCVALLHRHMQGSKVARMQVATTSGKWQLAGGRWQVLKTMLQVAAGRWQVASGSWHVVFGGWQLAGGRYHAKWQVARLAGVSCLLVAKMVCGSVLCISVCPCLCLCPLSVIVVLSLIHWGMILIFDTIFV